MIESMLITTTLLLVILFFFIYTVVSFKSWIIKRDKVLEEKIHNIRIGLHETQSLFNNEIKGILGEFKKILNQ